MPPRKSRRSTKTGEEEEPAVEEEATTSPAPAEEEEAADVEVEVDYEEEKPTEELVQEQPVADDAAPPVPVQQREMKELVEYPPSRVLFVSRYDTRTSDDEIKDFFSEYGTIEKISKTQKFCFVVCADVATAQAAVDGAHTKTVLNSEKGLIVAFSDKEADKVGARREPRERADRNNRRDGRDGGRDDRRGGRRDDRRDGRDRYDRRRRDDSRDYGRRRRDDSRDYGGRRRRDDSRDRGIDRRDGDRRGRSRSGSRSRSRSPPRGGRSRSRDSRSPPRGGRGRRDASRSRDRDPSRDRDRSPENRRRFDDRRGGDRGGDDRRGGRPERERRENNDGGDASNFQRIMRMAEEREVHRYNREFAKADSLRDALRDEGVEVKDREFRWYKNGSQMGGNIRRAADIMNR